jgi:hypothetical protein
MGAKKTAEGERQQVPWQIVIAYVEELFDDERVGKEDGIDDPGALLRLSLRFGSERLGSVIARVHLLSPCFRIKEKAGCSRPLFFPTPP